MWRRTQDNPGIWPSIRPEASWRAERPAAAIAAFLVLSLVSCAAVPDVDDELAAHAESPRIVAAHGPLSAQQSAEVLEAVTAEPGAAGMLARHLAIEERIAETPLVAGNATRILRDGPETFRAVFDLIRSARDHVNLEFYILENVESDGVTLGELLLAKVREGVAVNLIYDSHGSQETPPAFFETLRQGGVQVVEYNPLDPLESEVAYDPNARTHRKILVVDGRAGVTGGINLSRSYMRDAGSYPGGSGAGDDDEDGGDGDGGTPSDSGSGSGSGAVIAGESDAEPEAAPDAAGEDAAGGNAATADLPDQWRDTSILVEGPVVAQFQKLFVEHWRQQKGPPLDETSFYPEVAPAGDEVVRILGSSPDDELPRYYVAVLSAIRNAEARVWLTAAYFVPTAEEVEDLKAAAARGVDVRLLLPGVSDIDITVDIARAHYADLMDAGVRIWETHDAILHSKSIVVDGVWSVVGSSNFDHRSVIFNDEVDAVVLGSATGAELEAMFEADLAEAREIYPEEWRDRPLLQRLEEHFNRVWERWL